MAILDKVRVFPEGEQKALVELPGPIKERLDRGRERTKHFANDRNLAWEFWRNNMFAYITSKNKLTSFFQGPVGMSGPGKDPWRSRLTRNIFRGHCEMEVSIATQRTPSFQVVPSGSDPSKVAAAKLSEKAAHYGFDKWSFHQVAEDVARHCIVGDEGFAWPIWDDSTGPFVDDGEGGTVGLGEVKVRVFGANQVGWEPGVSFEDSPWHYVEYACPPQEVMDRDDYIPGKGPLKPDADSDDLQSSEDRASKAKLVRVVEYLERPSKRFPKGRWVTVANNRVVAGKVLTEEGFDFRPYPCAEYGYDGLALHYLPYYRDSDSDRGHGPGRDAVDAVRTIIDCLNRITEWKNLALNPQTATHPGALKGQVRTDEPGKNYEVPNPKETFHWIDTPRIPQELFEMIDRAYADLARIFAQTDVQAAESGKQIQFLASHDLARRDAFFKREAKFLSGLMRHCLFLMRAHYSEERVLQIRGPSGWEPVEDFLGASLQDELDVRVMPDSIIPTSREQVEAKIFAYADRQWISAERAKQAIEEGSADGLIADIEQDVSRVNRIIRAVQAGLEVLFSMPIRMGPDLEPVPGALPGPDGMPQMRPVAHPGWMPRPFDNVGVHMYYMETFMKSQEFELLRPEMQAACYEYHAELERIGAEKAAQQAMQQQAVAEGQGMANAARPSDRGSPDMPQPHSGEAPTQNQPPDQGFPNA